MRIIVMVPGKQQQLLSLFVLVLCLFGAVTCTTTTTNHNYPYPTKHLLPSSVGPWDGLYRFRGGDTNDDMSNENEKSEQEKQPAKPKKTRRVKKIRTVKSHHPEMKQQEDNVPQVDVSVKKVAVEGGGGDHDHDEGLAPQEDDRDHTGSEKQPRKKRMVKKVRRSVNTKESNDWNNPDQKDVIVPAVAPTTTIAAAAAASPTRVKRLKKRKRTLQKHQTTTTTAATIAVKEDANPSITLPLDETAIPEAQDQSSADEDDTRNEPTTEIDVTDAGSSSRSTSSSCRNMDERKETDQTFAAMAASGEAATKHTKHRKKKGKRRSWFGVGRPSTAGEKETKEKESPINDQQNVQETIMTTVEEPNPNPTDNNGIDGAEELVSIGLLQPTGDGMEEGEENKETESTHEDTQEIAEIKDSVGGTEENLELHSDDKEQRNLEATYEDLDQKTMLPSDSITEESHDENMENREIDSTDDIALSNAEEREDESKIYVEETELPIAAESSVEIPYKDGEFAVPAEINLKAAVIQQETSNEEMSHEEEIIEQENLVPVDANRSNDATTLDIPGGEEEIDEKNYDEDIEEEYFVSIDNTDEKVVEEVRNEHCEASKESSAIEDTVIEVAKGEGGRGVGYKTGEFEELSERDEAGVEAEEDEDRGESVIGVVADKSGSLANSSEREEVRMEVEENEGESTETNETTEEVDSDEEVTDELAETSALKGDSDEADGQHEVSDILSETVESAEDNEEKIIDDDKPRELDEMYEDPELTIDNSDAVPVSKGLDEHSNKLGTANRGSNGSAKPTEIPTLELGEEQEEESKGETKDTAKDIKIDDESVKGDIAPVVTVPDAKVSVKEVDVQSLAAKEDDETDITVSVVTWNLAEGAPSEEAASFIRQFRDSPTTRLSNLASTKSKKMRGNSDQGSDIVLISGQECENVKPRRAEGHRSREIRRLMIHHLGKKYVPLAIHSFGGIQFGLFCKRSILGDIEACSIADVACGIGNVFHNKGGIAAFVQIKAKKRYQNKKGEDGPDRAKSLRMLFVSAHMAAHVKNVEARNMDFWRIASELEAQAPTRFLPPKDGGDGGEESGGVYLLDSMDRVFFCGDLNYRVDLPREIAEFTVSEMADASSHGLFAENLRMELLRHDQLLRTMAEGRAFPNFAEGKITFPPTFKFDKGTTEYDTSHKQRIPAWTDRVLFKPQGVRVLEYDSVQDATHSDHRPVFATFRVSMQGRELSQNENRRRRRRVRKSSERKEL